MQGDGQCDSPSQGAKYLFYSLEEESGVILTSQRITVGEVECNRAGRFPSMP